MSRALPQEHSFQLKINQKNAISLICTREALRELAVGWLYNEGLISGLEDIRDLQICPSESDEKGSYGEVLHKEASLNPCADEGVETVRTTGLGGIGVNRAVPLGKIEIDRKYSQEYILECKDAMAKNCPKYEETGGMHCSALFDQNGLVLLYEDIGRHNTLDKLAGRCLLDDIAASDCLLITTGRISKDMVKKAARMGVSVIASYKTPTEQAYQMAKKLGMTVIGYLRKMPLQVYCGVERIC